LGEERDTEYLISFLVMDSGMGIPANQLVSIFERLAQGDPDVERNYGGTGLGLFICKCLVEQMGGVIWAENRKEGGATLGFNIRFEKGSLKEAEEELLFLPDALDTDPESDEEYVTDYSAPEPQEIAGNNGTHETEVDGNKKILIADDCEETCKLMSKYLEDTPYDVEVVHNGIEALKKYDSAKYDLILMDIQMPEMDGVGTTMEIRSRESKGATKTPIFAMVGDSSDEDGYHLAADFDQCLNKPISKETLLKAVTTLNPQQ
jgi:CheY-like chemotaxis protein